MQNSGPPTAVPTENDLVAFQDSGIPFHQVEVFDRYSPKQQSARTAKSAWVEHNSNLVTGHTRSKSIYRRANLLDVARPLLAS